MALVYGSGSDSGSGVGTTGDKSPGTGTSIGIFYGRSDEIGLVFVPKAMTFATFEP